MDLFYVDSRFCAHCWRRATRGDAPDRLSWLHGALAATNSSLTCGSSPAARHLTAFLRRSAVTPVSSQVYCTAFATLFGFNV